MMCSAKDEDASYVARAVYENLLESGAPARATASDVALIALHLAVCRVRDESRRRSR